MQVSEAIGRDPIYNRFQVSANAYGTRRKSGSVMCVIIGVSVGCLSTSRLGTGKVKAISRLTSGE
jgi:hypothetical protein